MNANASAGSNGNQPNRVFVAGIWRDYGRQQGAIAMDEADYTRMSGDTLGRDGWIELAPGAHEDSVTASLRAALPASLSGRVAFVESRSLRALSLQIFDRSFAVTYVLETIAMLVGLAGVAATFSAQTLARTKEFGMLRHIGVLRRQIVAMLAAEGAFLGTVVVIPGIGLGTPLTPRP